MNAYLISIVNSLINEEIVEIFENLIESDVEISEKVFQICLSIYDLIDSDSPMKEIRDNIIDQNYSTSE
ncbi:hypothetical protein TVAG_356530 [Trichomonas vaginalis G3]|uniref:Uncharacterized protein n=1 Tax=Trichomonas vaginalis (strain ATCC PRA-98 / G3) TaxID=412133 RepID=A2FM72_TRIV3|nr:hypothetical protein TVAGG3_0152440 [Trichomonas vaginalis G3]EAX94006.1 hypothetical protein TVAG_356530 [Trichomonas vaginalis G3]KAI5547371.1 hypothetical protein TVAGG3_0152440 [Trichomonas vaginalis G3]|eukprot:XP_001306936.1 hypothetical protein [Trichomonas vaginalis G3]